MNIIVTRPEHDVTTRYLSAWAEEIIVFARKKGNVVIDLFREKANRTELEGRVKKIAPDVVFLNGHGSDTSITGHDNKVLIDANINHSVLAGMITYALSCDAGKVLGERVVQSSYGFFLEGA